MTAVVATSRAAAAVSCASMVLIALSACATRPSVDDTVPPVAHAFLGDAVLAFVLNPQAPIEPDGGPGVVVLVGPDGEVRSIETAGMDNGQLAWSSDGLHFSDVENDYLLAERLRVEPSDKTDLQQAMFALEGGRSVALYNEGVGEEGYIETVVASGPDGSVSSDVTGVFDVTALCGSELVGVSSGSTEPGPGGLDAGSPALTRLWDGGTASPEVLGRASEIGTVQVAADAPCADGVVHTLAAVPGEDGAMHAVVRSWDTRSGRSLDHRLADAEGAALPLTADDVLFAQYDSGSLLDDGFEWLSADGRVMRTDPATGRTVERFAVDRAEAGNVRSVFSGDRVWIVADPLDGGGRFEVASYDRATGAPVSRFTVSVPQAAASPELVLRDVAVPPAG